jgi:phosphoribosylformylglycinamidine cyclo-ligase
MAHITGGGLTGNLPRVLPPGCRAVIDRGTWPVSEVFRWLQGRGRIDEAEMFRVFNMGIGFVLVVPPLHAARVLARLWRSQTPAFQIGEIRRGARGVTYR